MPFDIMVISCLATRCLHSLVTYCSIVSSADGAYCLTCGSDKSIKLWNPRKPLLLQTYNGHGNDVLDAQGSTDSSQILSCGVDKYVPLTIFRTNII